MEKITKESTKKVTRCIRNSHYYTNTQELFNNLGILSYPKLITRDVSFTSCTWSLNSERVPELNLKNSDEYTFPLALTFTKFPLYTFPKVWNEAGACKFHRIKALFWSELKAELPSCYSPN
jgi:hypothetical protein